MSDTDDDSESSAILENGCITIHGVGLLNTSCGTSETAVNTVEEDCNLPDSKDSLSSKSHSVTVKTPTRKKKKKKKKWIGICTSHCRYDSVRRVSKRFGMKEVSEDGDWTIFWTDYSVTLERVMDMKRFQKINHFPGMNEICRKDFLARNLNRLQKLYPKEYNCFPKTWCLPADFGDFQSYCRSKKNRTFICKPETGCQGKGIYLVKNPKDIKRGERLICQQYINKCLTIDGFKFDFRIYVLVTSCDPLRIFVHKEGLGRFATKKYQEPTNHNLDEACMHLTNYAINKNSEDFIRDDMSGSKRKLATVCKWLAEHEYDVDEMWSNIEDVIIKTLISAHPILKHNYKTCFPNHIRGSACFEILGFDVMLDQKMKAWLLEVNHSPSFHTDAELDKDVKETLLYDCFELLDLKSADRKKCLEEDRKRVKERLLTKTKSKECRMEEKKNNHEEYLVALEKHEDEHMGGFRRIYPTKDYEKYNKYFKNSCSLFQTTAAAKAREEAARAQLEELRIKQEKHEALMKGRKYRIDMKKEGGEAAGERRRPLLAERNSLYKGRTRSSKILFNLSSKQDTPESELSNSSLHPIDIDEDEELERLRMITERDTYARSMGLAEEIERMLHFQQSLSCKIPQIWKNSSSLTHHFNINNNSVSNFDQRFYLKTRDALTIPACKYPDDRHYCSRNESPLRESLNKDIDKSLRKYSCLKPIPISYNNEEQCDFPSPKRLVRTDCDKPVYLEIFCRGLPKLPPLTESSKNNTNNRSKVNKNRVKTIAKPNNNLIFPLNINSLVLSRSDINEPFQVKYSSKLPYQVPLKSSLEFEDVLLQITKISNFPS